MRRPAGARSSLPGALLAALLLATGSGATEPGASVLGAPLHEHRLGNGLQVVVVPWDSPGVMAYVTLVRTGSRDEVEPGKSGFAHFFEHMMFRGTPRHPEEEYTRTLRGLGADDNAGTSDDRTIYTILAPASGLETIMELEADRFQNLDYSREVFRTEARAVLGEYHTVTSSPEVVLLERLRNLAFDHHPYEHATLGFVEDIRAMPEGFDYSRRFFDRFYRPENCALVIVGDVDPANVFALAERHYGDWAPGYQPPQVPAEPEQRAPRRETLHRRGPTAPWLALGYRAPAFSTATVDTAAIDVLGSLLFDEGSVLYQDLVVKRRLADVLLGFLVDHRDPYLFEILVRATAVEHLPVIEAAITDAAATLAQRAVEEERLEAVKAHLRYAFALELDSPMPVATNIAHYLALTGSASTVHEVFARYTEVTPENLKRLAAALFREEGSTVIHLLPAAGGETSEGGS
jgi:zinc protease